MREKIVLVGAGSAMFTRGLVADLITKRWDMDLALVDTDPAALAVAEGLVKKMIAAREAPIRLAAACDRRVVLRGATAVITTIGVGGRRAWEQDVFIPRKYGIYQPVGDSVMPGGTSRALRMIPPMVAIAEDLLDLAPNALFFNYGNPMACVCRAVRKATGAPVVGLCHGVHDVARYLARCLDVPFEEFRHVAVGMNHLTWFVEVCWRHEDLMPRLRRLAAERVHQFREFPGEPDAATLQQENPFSWSLMHLFGAFPAVLDRHVSEFFPQFFAHGNYYGKRLGVDASSFNETIARGDRIFEEMRRDAESPGPLRGDYFERIGGEHEQVVEIIESIRTGAGRIYSANLPNTGQVPHLPAEAIIEAPAVADAFGVRAIAQRPLPAAIAGTLATRLQWVETTVEAALEGSREKFVQALVLDGSVGSLDEAAALADDLLAAHRAYLPQFTDKAPGAKAE